MAALLFLLLSAFVIQGASLGLQARHKSYHSHPHIHAPLYAVGVVLAFQALPSALHHPALHTNLPLALLWLGLALATVAFNRTVPIPRGYRSHHPKSYFLDFNLAFILVKTADILFQQSFLMVFILLLSQHVPQLSMVAAITSLLFIAVHLPLLWVQRKVSVLHILGATLFISAVPYILLQLHGGFWLIAVGHGCFYIAIRLLMALKPVRRSLLGDDIKLPSS
jgi:hypothetical protein